MSATVQTIRHFVAIAGCVRDAPLTSNRRSEDRNSRVAGALVQILEADAPAAFQTMLAAQRADPAWKQRKERIDRTWSRTDGIFYFSDLPPGAYRLQISMARLGLRSGDIDTDPRFGIFETNPLTVPVQPDRPGDQPVALAWIDVVLPTTRIRGVVTRQNSTAPIAGATVRLRGDTASGLTKDDGSYELRRLVAGHPTLEVVAINYTTFQQKVVLERGQMRQVDVQLTPV